MKKVLSFLNPLNPYGQLLGKVSGPLALLVAVVVLAMALIPGSPLRPGTEFAKGETGLAGELTAADVAAAKVGAAVDYPTPGEYLAANGLRFSYLAPSVPNFGYGSGTHGQNDPTTIVLHVAGGSCAGMRNWFMNPSSGASSQFGICNDGAIEQYVEIEDAAYTQGIYNSPSPYAAIYGGINPNLRSVSIELEGCGSGDYAPMSDKPKQEASLRLLLSWLSERTGIPLDREHVLGHFDIDSVNRSNDPLCVISDYDGFVASLKPPAPPQPQVIIVPARSALRVYQAGGAMFVVAAGELAHIPSVEALASLWPYEVLPLSQTVYQVGVALYVATDGALAHIPDSRTLDRLHPYVAVRVD